MRWISSWLLAVFVAALTLPALAAQAPGCPPRPTGGKVVSNPTELDSQNRVLRAALTTHNDFRVVSAREHVLYLEECYVYQSPAGAVEAPTLQLNPGDQLILDLTNRLTYQPPPPLQRPSSEAGSPAAEMPSRQSATGSQDRHDPCSGGAMTATSTNIHFHGMNIPPVCHQDDVLHTVIENTDPPFEYKIRIPPQDAPGMYWYHPHLHGFTTLQVNGGLSGALIIGGMEKVKPQVAGLPERVLLIRQEFLNPNSWQAGPYELTVNYQPAVAPNWPVIQMQPGAREFWRVANATSQEFLALQIQIDGVAQKVEVIALDGVPVKQDSYTTKITLPPAGRAEFIVQGPTANQTAAFWEMGYNTGAIGNPNLPQQLAVIQPSADAQEPPSLPPAAAPPAKMEPNPVAALMAMTPTASRSLYFSEASNGTGGPTEYFITVNGQTPKVFTMSEPPAVTTRVGAVEDWTVENRTGDVHAFHIHQLHFVVLATNGVDNPDPESIDTVPVPAWSGTGPYPSVKMRLDFRDPEIAGTFVFHCHILDHEDAGMMAKILVLPAASGSQQ